MSVRRRTFTRRYLRVNDYRIREFQGEDVDDFLALYGEVFSGEHSREWFSWKYLTNPYLDHVSIFVAEHDGDVVGARPFMPVDMAVDGDRYLALQPADAMVHSDHRRRGLFTRMTEVAIERYEDGRPSFCFNFPNARTFQGNLQLGWRMVGTVPTYYRIENPVAATGSSPQSPMVSIAKKAADPLADGYYWLRNSLSRSESLPVQRYDSIPAGRLADIAAPPAGRIRAVRDRTFFEWRFDNPEWEYTTYVVDRSRGAVAAVVGTKTIDDVTTTKLTDFVGTTTRVPDGGIESLLARIVDDNADSDLLAAWDVVPESVLTRSGFHVDDQPPLSYVSSETIHVVRTLRDDWTVAGVDIADGDNWRLSFAEKDTS